MMTARILASEWFSSIGYVFLRVVSSLQLISVDVRGLMFLGRIDKLPNLSVGILRNAYADSMDEGVEGWWVNAGHGSSLLLEARNQGRRRLSRFWCIA
jgi:hypothetical protein